MYKRTLKKEISENFNTGINISDFSDYVNYNTEYKHGDMYDLTIIGTNYKQILKIPSREVMTILKTWGIDAKYSGTFTLTLDHEKSTRFIKVNNDIEFNKYVCDSRAILKNINTLSKNIRGARNLAGRKESDGRWGLSTQLLLTAVMCSDPVISMQLLDKIQTQVIVKELKSAKFKHIYKLIHPDTEFIKEDPHEHIQNR